MLLRNSFSLLRYSNTSKGALNILRCHGIRSLKVLRRLLARPAHPKKCRTVCSRSQWGYFPSPCPIIRANGAKRAHVPVYIWLRIASAFRCDMCWEMDCGRSGIVSLTRCPTLRLSSVFTSMKSIGTLTCSVIGKYSAALAIVSARRFVLSRSESLPTRCRVLPQRVRVHYISLFVTSLSVCFRFSTCTVVHSLHFRSQVSDERDHVSSIVLLWL